MTEKIRNLTKHFAKHKKDKAGKRGYQVCGYQVYISFALLYRSCAVYLLRSTNFIGAHFCIPVIRCNTFLLSLYSTLRTTIILCPDFLFSYTLLQMLVSKRNRMMQYLMVNDVTEFGKVVDSLGLIREAKFLRAP